MQTSNSHLLSEQIETHARNLAALENDVEVISTIVDSGLPTGTVDTVKYTKLSTKNIFDALRLWTKILLGSYDVLHVFSLKAPIVTLTAKVLRPGKTLVLTVEDFSAKGNIKESVLESALLKRADSILSPNPAVHRFTDLEKYKIQYMHQPVSVKRVAVDSNLLRAYGLVAGDYVLVPVHPGRKQEIESLLKFWRDSLKTDLSRLQLVFIETEFSLDSDEHFGERVKWLGYVGDEAKEVLSAGARAVLTPNLRDYRFEALDAMSYGKVSLPVEEMRSDNPIIYSDLQPYIGNTNLSFGLLADVMEASTLGHQAREAVEYLHDANRLTAPLERLYENLIENGAVAKQTI